MPYAFGEDSGLAGEAAALIAAAEEERRSPSRIPMEVSMEETRSAMSLSSFRTDLESSHLTAVVGPTDSSVSEEL